MKWLTFCYSKTMSDLDSALLFAAAGQLEADITGQSLESCQAALAQAAKVITYSFCVVLHSAFIFLF